MGYANLFVRQEMMESDRTNITPSDGNDNALQRMRPLHGYILKKHTENSSLQEISDFSSLALLLRYFYISPCIIFLNTLYTLKHLISMYNYKFSFPITSPCVSYYKWECQDSVNTLFDVYDAILTPLNNVCRSFN